MINFIIPNTKEIYATIFFIYLILTFYFNGSIVTNTSDLNINFAVGWSIFIFLAVFLNLFLKIKLNYFFNIYTILSTLILVKKIKFLKIYFFKRYIFILPIFLIFISSKTHGYDSFAFLLDKVIYLLNNETFPTREFRSNYPFTFSLIHYYSNFYLGEFTENIPALIDMMFIISSINIFNNIIKKEKKNLFNNCIIPFLTIIIFFNPMVMNVYSFSSYEDFKTAYILLVIFYFNYQHDFNLELLIKNKIIYILLLSLLSVSKATGFVHTFSILLSNILIYYFSKNKSNFKEILVPFFILSFFSFSHFLIWQIHIILNNIEVGNSYKGFRLEIFNNILINYFNQFKEKKILLFSNFLFLALPFFYKITKKLKEMSKVFIFIFFPVLIWNLFHLIFFIYIQGYGHALEFHNYFRYLSQYSLIYTAAYLIIFLKFFKLEVLKKIKNLNIIIILTLYIIFLANIEKFRRDASAEYNFANNVRIYKSLNIKENLNQLEVVIKDFYIRNKLLK